MKKRKTWAEISAPLRQDPAAVARMEIYGKAIDTALALGALREHRGQTQQEVAAGTAVSQSRISKIEHQQDIYLSTLREYVEALGGHLELVAVFPDERVILEPAAEPESVPDVSRASA